jgi:hypothetical protein
MASTPYFSLHQRVDEAPADGGVEDFRRAGEGFGGLALHEWRTGHGFDAAGNGEIDFTGADGAGAGADGIEAGGAKAVQRGAGNGIRQAGQQRGHAGDVAVVFTGLVGAAEIDFLDGSPIHAGIAVHQGFNGGGGEVVGANFGKGAAETADGGADGVANEDIAHQFSPWRLHPRSIAGFSRWF